jgi:hypothetical protein
VPYGEASNCQHGLCSSVLPEFVSQCKANGLLVFVRAFACCTGALKVTARVVGKPEPPVGLSVGSHVVGSQCFRVPVFRCYRLAVASRDSWTSATLVTSADCFGDWVSRPASTHMG